jgi:hypothetical protein
MRFALGGSDMSRVASEETSNCDLVVIFRGWGDTSVSLPPGHL